jgi:hypothetical protein
MRLFVFQFLTGHLDEINLKKPGPTSKSRFMMRIIYCCKILLFKDDFPMTPKERHAIEELAQFYAHVYAVPWFRAPIVADAAFLDLAVWNKLHEYKRFD